MRGNKMYLIPDFKPGIWNAWTFIVLTAIMTLCFHKEALIEEKYCLDKYGDVYRKYMDGIPRWIGIHAKNYFD